MPDDKQAIWSDLKLQVNTHLEQLWQTDWDTEVDNKLHEIRPNLKQILDFDERLNRKQETVVSRLRIGHSWITHGYLLKGQQQPYCTACESPFTVKHILVECADFLLSRQKYFKTTHMQTLFREVKASQISDYLRLKYMAKSEANV
ncbi:RNA-directed DNA polymerase from transposon X-element [Elysia marginata]|uniref:RNA-directed DNA polymerase from transposon X-element n=1 Tax=Elysia marginata TaxID=1093978 RepID=A0AAV4JRS0_9GAST|nr:RNA-directed DNA polymerase from transposon X-element [Elysia marginata]